MSTFVEAVANQESRTTNGMKARKSTASACVDLFFKIGASRGKNIVPEFTAAYVEDSDLALRIVQWARDARGGGGERELFRQVLRHLEVANPQDAMRLVAKVPELGRYDDLLVFKTAPLKTQAFTLLGDALRAGNGLAAKWTPRKGDTAREIREFFGMTPKQYRKSLVNLTKVVETQMCAKDFDNIEFSHVPSVAHARYKKAFTRNTDKYAEYVQKLVKGEAGVKINAGAVYPYDVLKGAVNGYQRSAMSATELNAMSAQWDALPNYVGDARVLPMVDSSGSMTCQAGGRQSKSTMTCLEVALGLGLYFADKNTGAFKDTFLTFSAQPKLVTLKGSIVDKLNQMNTGEVANTNLHAAFNKVLDVAVKNGVPQSEMPETLLILSDMQFDQGCSGKDESAMTMIERKYAAAGYTVPRIVFWNLNAHDNVPVKFDKTGTALVSGFSPAIADAVLTGDLEDFTPYNVMLKAVMKPRYNLA
jgi:hypothetical protein